MSLCGGQSSPQRLKNSSLPWGRVRGEKMEGVTYYVSTTKFCYLWLTGATPEIWNFVREDCSDKNRQMFQFPKKL
jgi:hypothetical protein